MAELAHLSIGDRVYLATDPIRAEGTVSAIECGRVYVTWDRAGRTWLYPASWLVKA